MKTNELSSCCSAAIKTSCADEGTCCYVCKKCENVCDVLVSWEKEAKLLYQLMIGQLEDVTFNQFFEFIRKQRQEGYNEGRKLGQAEAKFNNDIKIDLILGEKTKEAVREFAEKIYKILCDDDANYAKTEAMLELKRIYREALEVYEWK